MKRRRWLIAGLVAAGIPCLALLPCAQRVRNGDGWTRSAHSLKQIGIALQTYHETFGRLPPAVVTDPAGRPLYSWRVSLLPFLEQDALYRKFRPDEPWDSLHNLPLSRVTPRCYVPALGGDDPPGLTRYRVFVGPGTAFERDGLTWADFPDGLADTLLVVEAGEPVPWSAPDDLAYAPDRPLPSLGGVFVKPVRVACYAVGGTPGFPAVFADGSARFVPHSTDEATIRGLVTRNGGEPVSAPR